MRVAASPRSSPISSQDSKSVASQDASPAGSRQALFYESDDDDDAGEPVTFLVKVLRCRVKAGCGGDFAFDDDHRYAVALGGDGDPRRTEWVGGRGSEARFVEEFVFQHDPDDAAPVLTATLLRKRAAGTLAAYYDGGEDRVGDADVALDGRCVLPRTAPRFWVPLRSPASAAGAAFLGCAGPGPRTGGEELPLELQVAVFGFRPLAMARACHAYKRMRRLEAELLEVKADRDDLLRRLLPPPPEGAEAAAPEAAARGRGAAAPRRRA
ncbi:hypothetical protein JL722_2902 [Aureococcus anophagefferens]|nr:hypothetical protein JL722_2902 [Aureococcus anophagefferens]